MADYFAELNCPVPEGLVDINHNARDHVLHLLAPSTPLELRMQECLDHLQSLNMVPPCAFVLRLHDVLARCRCFVFG